MNKKIMASVLIMSVLATVAPVFALDTNTAVNFLVSKNIVSANMGKATEKITNAELLTTVLKAQNVMKGETVEVLADANAVMARASEKGLVKSNEGLSKANGNPTIEQAAMVVYRVMKEDEKLGEYWGQYDYSLDHMTSDYNKISPYYRSGVAMSFAKGLLSWTDKTKTSDRWGVRYLYPKNFVTRTDMYTMVAKLVDKGKRATPRTLNELRQIKTIISFCALEGKTSRIMSFENGRPFFDKEKELVELWKTNKSPESKRFDESLKHNDFINSEWALEQTLDYKTAEVYSMYESTYNYIEKQFNVSYKDDLVEYEKELRFYTPQLGYTDEYVKRHLKMIKDQKLTVESILVTDPQMFYGASDESNRTKIRLFFKYSSSIAKTVKMQKRMLYSDFGESTVKTNQWYMVDLEGVSSFCGAQEKYSGKWATAKYTYDETYYLSHFVPVVERK